MSIPGKNKVTFIMEIYRVSTEDIPCTNRFQNYCIPYSNRKTCFRIIKAKSLGATQFSPSSSL